MLQCYLLIISSQSFNYQNTVFAIKDYMKQRKEQLLRYFRLLGNLDISTFQSILSTLPGFPPDSKQRLSFSPQLDNFNNFVGGHEVYNHSVALDLVHNCKQFLVSSIHPHCSTDLAFWEDFQRQDMEHWKDSSALYWRTHSEYHRFESCRSKQCINVIQLSDVYIEIDYCWAVVLTEPLHLDFSSFIADTDPVLNSS